MYLKYYELDLCHYFSAPGLTWDAMLKMTGITLAKIDDANKYMFFERGMRGGISYISKRYSQANNDVVEFDNKKPINYIGYFDMNNLYGRAIRQFLPVGKFKWVKNIGNIDLMNIKDDSSIGYIFEVILITHYHLKKY